MVIRLSSICAWNEASDDYRLFTVQIAFGVNGAIVTIPLVKCAINTNCLKKTIKTHLFNC